MLVILQGTLAVTCFGSGALCCFESQMASGEMMCGVDGVVDDGTWPLAKLQLMAANAVEEKASSIRKRLGDEGVHVSCTCHL